MLLFLVATDVLLDDQDGCDAVSSHTLVKRLGSTVAKDVLYINTLNRLCRFSCFC